MIKKILLVFYNVVFRKGYNTFYWKKRFKGFGYNSRIAYPAFLQNTQFIEIGHNTTILSNARIQNFYPKAGETIIKIGSGCFIGFNLSLLNASRIEIGDNVLFASNVLITSENHGMDPESDIPYMDQTLFSMPVIIEEGCWVGEKVCIMPGVTIGSKSIIGAGSIVTKSIPPYCIAVGNPAKVIKKYNFKSHKWETV